MNFCLVAKKLNCYFEYWTTEIFIWWLKSPTRIFAWFESAQADDNNTYGWQVLEIDTKILSAQVISISRFTNVTASIQRTDYSWRSFRNSTRHTLTEQFSWYIKVFQHAISCWKHFQTVSKQRYHGRHAQLSHYHLKSANTKGFEKKNFKDFRDMARPQDDSLKTKLW